MTNPDTSPILLDDYATLGSTLLATNLANNPGFETLGTPYAATNFYTYPSAARGDATGWDNGFGSNVKPSLVADATFPGGWAFTRTVTALTGIVTGTNSYVPATATNLTGAYLPAVTGSLNNIASLYVKTSVVGSMYLRAYETYATGPSAGVQIATLATTTWTSVAGAVTRITVPYTLTDISRTIVLEVGTTASLTGTVTINGAMVNIGTTVAPYFDGSYAASGAFLTNWLGAAYESVSTLSADQAKNAVGGTDTLALRSYAWQYHGQYSMQVWPLGTSNATSIRVAGAAAGLVGSGVTFVPGHTYTVKATLHLSAVQAGSLNASSRTLQATYNGTGGTTVSSTASANAVGTYAHSITFTIPANATLCNVQLWNGSSLTSVYWDDLLIVDTTAGGAYSGGWFSGSAIPNRGEALSWVGTAEDSASLYYLLAPQPKLAELQSLSYDYAGINSPYADDDALALGVANFTTKSKKNLKFWQGRTVWPRRGTDNPRRSLVRNVTKSQDIWSLAADTGATERNYDYPFLPVVSNETGISFNTTDGKTFRPLSNPDSMIPKTVLPGFVGNGLAALAQLAQAYGAFAVEDELAFSYKYLRRDYGEGQVLTPQNISDWGLTVDRSEPARNIEVIWYEGAYGDNVEVVPTDTDVISVNAGETVELDIETGAWLQNVNQPVCVDWVEADVNYYSGSSGVYAIAGNDNVPIQPSEWIANGGSITVSINKDDPRTLHVIVKGMTVSDYSPYRVAMAADDPFYPALRVTADAVTTTPHTLKLPTGVDENLTKTDVGVTIDNPFVQSLDQAYNVGTRVARRYNGLVMSLAGSGEGITPFALLDYEWVRYIIRDISGDPSSVVSFNAEEFTRMGDFQEVWPRATYSMADFMAVWPRSKYTMSQYMLEELRNPLRSGPGVVFDMHNGTWGSEQLIDNGNGTWSSDLVIDLNNGMWAG